MRAGVGTLCFLQSCTHTVDKPSDPLHKLQCLYEPQNSECKLLSSITEFEPISVDGVYAPFLMVTSLLITVTVAVVPLILVNG